MAAAPDGNLGYAWALLLGMARQRRRNRLGMQSTPARSGGPLASGTWSWPAPPSSGTGEDEPWRAPEEPVPVLGLGERLRFGLNQSRCFSFTEEAGALVHDEGRYGAAFDASLGDCATLGVQVVRQPGDVELTWPALSVQAGMTLAQQGVGAQVPTTSLLRPSGAIDTGAVVTEETLGRLTELLSTAHRYGVKVVFTLLHYGNGGVRLLADAAPTYPQDDEGVVAGSSEMPAAVRDLEMSHVRIDWSPDHHGQVIPDDELYAIDGSAYAFPAQDPYPTDGSTPPLHYRILDPWSPYMRIMARHLAELAGLALVEAHDRLLAENLEGYARLADVVEAVELLNEVDHDCTPDRTDMDGSGRAWGRVCYHMARGFRAAVPDSDVRVHLPGLSSYSSAAGQTWDDRRAFLRGLLAGMTAEYLARAPKLREPETAAALADKIQGIDLHAYHFRTDDPQVHAALLPHEVTELREAVVQGVADGAGKPEDAEPYRAIHVSLFETSTSVYTPAEGGTTRVPPVSPYTWMGAEQFQAFELWRRLLTSACAGVQTVGWHSWMGGTSGAFVGTGLRHDGVGVTAGGPGYERAAWHSYDAVRWLLRDCPGGSLVFPATTSRAEAEALAAGARTGMDRLLVFELRLDHMAVATHPIAAALGRERPASYGRVGWVYVLMLDPSIVLDDDDGVLVGTPADAGVTVYYVPSTGVGGDAFTGADPSTWEADADRFLEFRVSTLVGEAGSAGYLDPVVLLSTGRITWSPKVHELRDDIGDFPRWVLDRPAWWDAFPGPR